MPPGYLLAPAFVASVPETPVEPVIDFVQMASNSNTHHDGYQLVGGFAVDASEYSEVYFRVIASVTSGALTGTVQLFNLTDNVEVTTVEITNTTPESSEELVSLGTGTKVYEVRMLVADGTTAEDQILLEWAGLRLVT